MKLEMRGERAKIEKKNVAKDRKVGVAEREREKKKKQKEKRKREKKEAGKNRHKIKKLE